MTKTTHEVRHITSSIERHVDEVYAFVAEPQNLPKWATGLGDDFHKEGEDWIATGVLGRVRVRFCTKNGFGVVDHDVTLPSGEVTHNALRVVPNGAGSEVVFTVVRADDVDDAAFEADAAHVQKDLAALKALLEKR